MTITYKKMKDPISGAVCDDVIIKKDTNDIADTYIPFNSENVDYKTYLAWVAAGNTPDAAD